LCPLNLLIVYKEAAGTPRMGVNRQDVTEIQKRDEISQLKGVPREDPYAGRTLRIGDSRKWMWGGGRKEIPLGFKYPPTEKDTTGGTGGIGGEKKKKPPARKLGQGGEGAG